jgi:hypothetical protein
MTSIMPLRALLLAAGLCAAGRTAGAQQALRFLRQTEESTLRSIAIDPAMEPSLATRITLNLNSATRSQGLTAIVRASGVPLVFARDLLPSGTVRLVGDSFTVRSALEATLAGAAVDVFITTGGNLVLQRRSPNLAPPSETSLVVGTVTLESQAPLAGATVTIEGNASSAVTDTAGNFAVSTTRGRRILRVRALGFKPVNIPLTLDATHMSVSVITRRAGVQLDSIAAVGSVITSRVP